AEPTASTAMSTRVTGFLEVMGRGIRDRAPRATRGSHPYSVFSNGRTAGGNGENRANSRASGTTDATAAPQALTILLAGLRMGTLSLTAQESVAYFSYID